MRLRIAQNQSPRGFFATVAVVLLILLRWLPGAAAEDPLLVPPGEPPPSAVDDREAMYSFLDREAAELEQKGSILKTIFKVVSPTVVYIVAEKTEPSRRVVRDNVEEAGSGVVVEIGGKFYVLTNRHVVRDARLKDIKINLADGRSTNPTRVESDPSTDVAVLAVKLSGLVPARMGDSDNVEIGDFVLAVGSPFGLSQSVTYGIVSAKGRRDLELSDEVELQDFLQTDAAINPGNSGGPLVNLRGEVIGINTAIASNSGGNDGIGFSIPINMVMHVARQLVEKGTVVRAFLGVTLDHKFDAETAGRLGLPTTRGARITGLTRGAPAETAGLQVHDVIVSYNTTSVDDDTHLVTLVNLSDVGSEVPLVIYRGGEPLEVTVRVGNASEFKRSTAISPSPQPSGYTD